MIRFRSPAAWTAILLVRVSAEFEEERHDLGRIEPHGHLQGSFEALRVFLVIRVSTGIKLLSSSGQVIALDGLVEG